MRQLWPLQVLRDPRAADIRAEADSDADAGDDRHRVRAVGGHLCAAGAAARPHGGRVRPVEGPGVRGGLSVRLVLRALPHPLLRLRQDIPRRAQPPPQAPRPNHRHLCARHRRHAARRLRRLQRYLLSTWLDN